MGIPWQAGQRPEKARPWRVSFYGRPKVCQTEGRGDAEPRQERRRPEVACEPAEQPKAQSASETVWGALLLGEVSRAEI